MAHFGHYILGHNMSLKPFLLFIFALFLPFSSGAQEDNIDARNLLKLNLSDWYFARYELGFEHVLNESTSVQFAFAGIGAAEDFSNYLYNPMSGADNRTSVEVEHGGWRFAPEIRRYAWVYGGMPEGVFVAIQGRIENWTLNVDEDINQTGSTLPSDQFQEELDGTFTQFHWGGGVMVGYQWFSDNGISIEVYTGPMFRSFSRKWQADVALTNGEKELAEDSLEPRVFDSSRWDTYLNSNSGPGWRFGLTVGLGL